MRIPVRRRLGLVVEEVRNSKCALSKVKSLCFFLRVVTVSRLSDTQSRVTPQASRL
jgi:hypothetical protein